MEDFKRILVVSRMTTFCRQALHVGISLSKKYGADLLVIHVLYNPFAHGWNLPMISLEEEYKRDRETAKKQLDLIISSEREKGMQIREILREGNPVEEIVKTVGDEQIDLVILHAHDSHLDHFLYGYSSEDLIRKITCSTLLVKE